MGRKAGKIHKGGSVSTNNPLTTQNVSNVANGMTYLLLIILCGIVGYAIYFISTRNVKIIVKPANDVITTDENDSDDGGDYSNKNMKSNVKRDVQRDMEMDRKENVNTTTGNDFWGYGITSGYGTRDNKQVDMRPIINTNIGTTASYGVPINIATKGQPAPMQQVGYLYKTSIDEGSDIKTTKPQIMPILGGQTYSGSNNWVYYVMDNSTGIRMPLTIGGKKCSPNNNGCKELYDNDVITLPEYNATFQYKAYENNTPQYIPYI